MLIWQDNDKERDAATPFEIVSLITLAFSITSLLGILALALHILKLS